MQIDEKPKLLTFAYLRHGSCPLESSELEATTRDRYYPTDLRCTPASDRGSLENQNLKAEFVLIFVFQYYPLAMLSPALRFNCTFYNISMPIMAIIIFLLLKNIFTASLFTKGYSTGLDLIDYSSTVSRAKAYADAMPNTPPTPTRRNYRVGSRRRCKHNSQIAHDDCRRIRSTSWKLAKQTP